MATTAEQQAFHDELVRHRLILPSGVPGRLGPERGVRVGAPALRRAGRRPGGGGRRGAAPLSPGHTPARSSRRPGYLDSFPHLAGTVFSFTGSEAQARELSRRVHAGEPWAELQSQTDVALTPAACYPVYPTLAGRAPRRRPHARGAEPLLPPRAVGRSGAAPAVPHARGHPGGAPGDGARLARGVAGAVARAARLARARRPRRARLGPVLRPGREDAGREPEGAGLQVRDRRAHRLAEEPTAVCSFNYHQEHFGKLFDIALPDGSVAHTACLGFGLERVTLALFRRHGLDAREWPAAVRTALDG